jgi:hypothetical protein
MKLRLKENPREWRKAALFSTLGLALLSGLLRWRHVLSVPTWVAVLGLLACAALCACLRPRWFRGWYRLGGTVGYYLGRCFGFVALTILFVLIFIPLGILGRLFGNDPLRLKPGTGEKTFWLPARKSGPLDRLF